MYTLAYIIEYLAAIIWNKLFFVRSIKNKKNKSFYFGFSYSFFNSLHVVLSFFPLSFSFSLKIF